MLWRYLKVFVSCWAINWKIFILVPYNIIEGLFIYKQFIIYNKDMSKIPQTCFCLYLILYYIYYSRKTPHAKQQFIFCHSALIVGLSNICWSKHKADIMTSRGDFRPDEREVGMVKCR